MLCFHPEKGKEHYNLIPFTEDRSGRLYGYLIFDFKLTEDWKFDKFAIEKSIEVCHNREDSIGQETIKSFVSPILMPDWVNNQSNPHLFLLGLSAVCSFCLERPVYSPRNSFLMAEKKRVSLKTYLEENAGDGKFIENYKAVIVTSERNEVIGTFLYPVHIPGEHLQIPLILNIHDNQFIGSEIQFIGIEIHDENKLGEVIHKPTGMEIEAIYVIQHLDLRKFSLSYPAVSIMEPAASIMEPGSVRNKVHDDVLKEWKNRLDVVIKAIFQLDYEADNRSLDYVKMMQAMRLVQLAHQNHFEDFDLSYSLLIAGIEAIAQIAIPATKIDKHPSDKDWKKLCKINPNDPDSEKLNELFEKYKEAVQYVNNEISHRDLTKKFVEFILEYCPVEDWKIMTDRNLETGFLDDERRDAFDHAFRKATGERTPDMLTVEGQQKLVRNTYRYRSGFIHAGAPLPHQNPEGYDHNRFFEKVPDSKEWDKLHKTMKRENRNTMSPEEFERTKLYLINHNLMKSMARMALTSFLLKTVNG